MCYCFVSVVHAAAAPLPDVYSPARFLAVRCARVSQDPRKYLCERNGFVCEILKNFNFLDFVFISTAHKVVAYLRAFRHPYFWHSGRHHIAQAFLAPPAV